MQIGNFISRDFGGVLKIMKNITYWGGLRLEPHPVSLAAKDDLLRDRPSPNARSDGHF